MRLRRSKPTVSTGRRQRRVPEDAQGASTFAYRSRRSDEEMKLGRNASREPAVRQPRRMGRFLLKRSGLVILLIALLVSSVNILSLSHDVRVMSLSDNGGDSFMHDRTVYERAANKLLADSIWNRNKITVDTSHVSKGMLTQFPELSSASVTLPLFSKRPIVYIQTAQPALVLEAQNGSFVIDSTGKALLATDKLPSDNDLTLPIVTDQGGLNVTVNRQALTSGNVGFIQTVIAQLAAKGFKVTTMELPVGTSELDVRLEGQPYIVKFNLESGTARQQAGTFLATQNKLKSQNIVPGQYIDVRVDGRAYYK